MRKAHIIVNKKVTEPAPTLQRFAPVPVSRPRPKLRVMSSSDVPDAQVDPDANERFAEAVRAQRRRIGMTQAELAERMGWEQSQVTRLETGKRAAKVHEIFRLAHALQCSAAQLLSGDPGGLAMVPLRERIAFEDGPGLSLAGLPGQLPIAGSLERPDGCFAAVVADDSADKLYPAGSILVVRRVDSLAELGRPLAVGDRVVIRRFRESREDGRAQDVLVGLLQAVAGDLQVVLRSSSRKVASSVALQHAAAGAGHYERAFVTATAGPGTAIDYEPRPDDPAELLGAVVLAQVPG